MVRTKKIELPNAITQKIRHSVPTSNHGTCNISPSNPPTTTTNPTGIPTAASSRKKLQVSIISEDDFDEYQFRDDLSLPPTVELDHRIDIRRTRYCAQYPGRARTTA